MTPEPAARAWSEEEGRRIARALVDDFGPIHCSDDFHARYPGRCFACKREEQIASPIVATLATLRAERDAARGERAEAVGDPLSDMICETHPWMSWRHNDCPGPGMPEENLIGLYKRARAITNEELATFTTLRRALEGLADRADEWLGRPASYDESENLMVTPPNRESLVGIFADLRALADPATGGRELSHFGKKCAHDGYVVKCCPDCDAMVAALARRAPEDHDAL